MAARLDNQLKYLYRLERFEKIKPGLAVMCALLQELDNPQEAYPTIHISGTNGKGSTSAMLASMLQASQSPLLRITNHESQITSPKIARYTSPHLIRFNERVTINDLAIADAALSRLIGDVRTAVARAQLEPTFFEFTTALAFLHFAREQVDAAVIEVGMGGDLDATNVITPKLTIITNIGRDHTRWLGPTHHAVAEHKAGIIKPGVPLITAERRPQLLTFFQKICRQNSAPFLPVHRHLRPRYLSHNLDGQTFTVILPAGDGAGVERASGAPLRRARSLVGEHPVGVQRRQDPRALNKQTFALPLLGRHQIDNALTALLAFQEYTKNTLSPEQQLAAAKHGLQNVRWPGRLQIFSHNPFILLDGAHNPPAVRALSRALDELPLPEPGVLLLGSKQDKNINPLLKYIAPRFPHIITTEANFQPMPSAQLAQCIKKSPLRIRRQGGSRETFPPDKWGNGGSRPTIQSIPNLPEALAAAQAQLKPGKMLLITGSLYLVGDVLRALQTNN